MMRTILLILFSVFPLFAFAQENASSKTFWNSNNLLIKYRLSLPPVDYKPQLIDLDGDGDPDIIKSITLNGIPILWIDDSDSMTWDDIEGNTWNDCLLIDRNKDGYYGGIGDLIIDWVDTNDDGKADMQVLVEHPAQKTDQVWPNGHYMWVLDTDGDDIFNYIDWNTLKLKSWEKNGVDDFYADYSGNSAFMKIHAATYNLKDTRLNWENPFLFYDEDGDGLSEMAIRLVDTPGGNRVKNKPNTFDYMQLKGTIDWVSISVDMDNDNHAERNFDFDMTLNFRGDGFNYMDQIHTFKNMRGLPEADCFFEDPRWRQMSELIYPDHASAWNLIFGRGKWKQVYFVYDEDDDCNRWERVELLDPLDPFKIGTQNGGIDHNSQADAAGDRGEWDLDNSGNGNLYVSKFDGRIHLYGAEWGCWRIDPMGTAYQGFDRTWVGREPQCFATVRYTDNDNNNFFDRIEYDLDGDSIFEQVIDLTKLGISDSCTVIQTANLKYADFVRLKTTVADNMWMNARLALKVMEKYGLNTHWYAKLCEANSVQKKYSNGYWLQFYAYKELENYFIRFGEKELLEKLYIAYFSSEWDKLL